jgi:hypothetical protein
MFQTAIAERAVKVPVEELIPLSVLQLDLPVPGDGWTVFLAGRNIEVLLDDLGRESIARSDARQLLAEQRAYEARRAELLAAADRQAEEFDRQRRAQIWKGVSADMLPVGVSAGDAMLAAARDTQPKRRSLMEETLSNSPEMSYHAFTPNPDEES